MCKKIEIVLRQSQQDAAEETVLATFYTALPYAIDKESSIMEFPGLTIHLKEHSVYRDEKLIPLTHREFAVLAYLARHPKWVFSAKQIYSAVWNKDSGDYVTAVSGIINQLRRKLTPDNPKDGYIRTIIGSGYKFEIP